MAQCAGTQFTICFTANGSYFLPANVIFQNAVGPLTITQAAASNTNNGGAPINGGSTPGQSYTMFAGQVTVQQGGIQFDYGGSIPALNNHNIQVCAADDSGEICCLMNLTFSDDPNCVDPGGNTGGFSCNNLTVNDGATITPAMVASGATAFGSPVVAGLNGTTFSGDSSTSVTVSCTGANNGTIDLRLSDGTICPVTVNCGGGGGFTCNNLTVNDGATITPGMVASGATAFGDPVVAGIDGTQGTNPSTTSVTAVCTGTANGTIDLHLSDGTICPVNVNCSGNPPVGNSIITGSVIATNACNGSVRVCLQNTDGTPYFDQFDICGGPASPTGTTGPQNGSIPNCSLTNFGQMNGAQCFDMPYTPASNTATSDTIIVQPTDGANAPVGDALSIPFTFTACDGGGGGGTALTCMGSPTTVAAGSAIPVTSIISGGTAPYTITQLPVISPAAYTAHLSNTSSAIVVGAGAPAGNASISYTIVDSAGNTETCFITLVITTSCSQTATVAIVPSNPQPGDPITITVNGCDCPGYTHELLNGWYDDPVNQTGFNPNPVTIPIANPTADVIQTTIPATAPINQTYGFHALCCNV